MSAEGKPVLAFQQSSPALTQVAWSEQELARQRVLSQQMCEQLGGVLLEEELPVELASVERVLDIACGAGGWAMTLAEAFPHMQVCGVDSNRSCVESAQRLALARGLSNLTFQTGDMHTLAGERFAHSGFDLVNVAFIADALLSTDYVALMSHIKRLCRPGGIVRWMETELPITNSPAFERLMTLTCRALQEAGHSFISTTMWEINALFDAWRVGQGGQPLAYERRYLGITMMMGSWLRQAGWQNIGQAVHAVEVSAHLLMWEAFVQQALVFVRRITPFLLQQQVVSAAEPGELTRQLQDELRNPQFCGICYMLTVYGQRSDA